MTYKIAFFDIDGTLVDEHNEMKDSVKESIAKLKEKGIKVVLATGRAPFYTKKITNELDIDSVIHTNGAIVTHEGIRIALKPIDSNIVFDFTAIAREYGHGIVFIGDTEHSKTKDTTFELNTLFPYEKNQLPFMNYSLFKRKHVFQIYLDCPPNELFLYEPMLKKVSVLNWQRDITDIFTKNVSKATGIKAILEIEKIAPEEAIAFGDGINDTEMLAYVGLGVAMGNAKEEIKKYADYITSSVEEDGVAAALTHFNIID